MFWSAAVPPVTSVGRSVLLAALVVSTPAIVALSQVVIVPTAPQIGSSNPVTAEPLVSRPNTKPCVVQLFHNLEFADYTPKTYRYTPPSACPGPWAKVVFTADFTVTAGRQYDRTAAFYLGHANIYYGTTAEPRAALSPSWHVERDVTDLSAIFKTAETGEANLGNFVGVYNGVTYNGIIYANAALEFYPTSWLYPGSSVPDLVVPVEGSGGDAGTLNTTTDQITQALTLPTNVVRVYLDVIAQSQSNDEFWYFCVPNDQTSNLESCGNTAFRETEVTIDGHPAGVAPVYPWIYTGGIDPYLWEPITGVQTLNFKPYRVDLSPFAGLLADGRTHTIGIGVYNADSYFLATANLLIFTDHGTTRVSGGILANTLTPAPSPVITENIKTTGKTFTGKVIVTSSRAFTIIGFVNTSQGRVETRVQQTVDFSSTQNFDVTPSKDVQDVQQLTTVDSTSTISTGAFKYISEKRLRYPLTLKYSFTEYSNGSYTQSTQADQRDEALETQSLDGFTLSTSQLSNEVSSTDKLSWDSSGKFLGPSGGKAWQTYTWQATPGQCYSRSLTAIDQKLTAVKDGAGCR